MTTSPRRCLIGIVIVCSLVFQGCLPVSTRPVPTKTQAPATVTEMPMQSQTPSPTAAPSKVMPTPNSPTVTEVITVTPTLAMPFWQLTFFSDRSGLKGIYAIDISGMNAQEVRFGDPHLLFSWEEEIPEGIREWSPGGIDWSPNGEKVVVSRGFPGILVLSDWNGENVVQITDSCDAASFPQWSPDGSQIAFIYNAGQRPDCEFLDSSQIQLYDLETGQMLPFFSLSHPSRVNWVPGGALAYIATVSETDYSEVIRIVDPDGNVLWQIPENPASFTDLLGLDFSPDGTQLVFVGEIWPEHGPVTRDIYVYDLNTNTILNLTNGSRNNFSPVWSPDGNWIAFFSDRGGDDDIYLVRPDGSGLINVTQNPAHDTDPAWRWVTSP